jgi:hypothetical protein
MHYPLIEIGVLPLFRTGSQTITAPGPRGLSVNAFGLFHYPLKNMILLIAEKLMLFVDTISKSC